MTTSGSPHMVLNPRKSRRYPQAVLTGMVLFSHSLLSPLMAETVPSIRVTGDASLESETREAIRLSVNQPDGKATLVFSFKDEPLDLSKFRDVVIPIRNQTQSELDVLVQVSSDLKSSWLRSTSGRFMIRPGEPLNMSTLLVRGPLPAKHPLIKRLGNLYAFPWGHQRHWRSIDPSAILQASVRVDWHQAAAGQIIEISPPQGAGEYSIDPAKLETLSFPLLDPFGQLKMDDWPEKVQTAEDLREDGKVAVEFAASMSNPGDGRSRFGGLKNGPKFEATGFFRVEKYQDKWWFVDPEGNLFWSIGTTGVGSSSSTVITGREDLFPEIHRELPEINYYEENLRVKYGEDGWKEKHVDTVVARMLDWGLNTAGAWSIPEMGKTQRIPYTLMVHTDMQGLGDVEKIPDPWSKAFLSSLDKRLGDFAAEHANSTWLLGVFIDNELDWRGGNDLASAVLNSPKNTPARKKMLEFLRGRYEEIAALNKAWNTQFSDFEAIRSNPETDSTKARQRDLNDFLERFTDQYFKVCRAAMDKYFPNHLYLGSRFHIFNPIVTKAASRYCDVISVNIYQHSFEDFALKTDVDRPWIISEFHFGVRDRGVWGAGLTWAADAGNQADIVQAYLSDALRHPNMVGAHWFMWSDQVVTGRKDGENFGVGVVTITDRPVKTLTDAMHQVSSELYEFRLNPTAGRIGGKIISASTSEEESETVDTP